MPNLTTPVSFAANSYLADPQEGELIFDAQGHLFGTTIFGGANNGGTVFELTDTGSQPTPPVPPDLTGGFGTVFYTPNGAPMGIDTNIVVSDATSATMAGATVAIGAGFLAGDTLNFTNQNGITGTYDAATGVLTLTGTASLADYDDAFAGITFSSTSGNPSNSGADPSRTVSWTVTDGTLSSNTVTTTVDINTIQTPTLITLVSFNFTDGSDPEAGVMADTAGDLLGTTFLGGPNGKGTVFDIFKTNGTYASTPTTLLYSAYGTFPTSGLIANAAESFFGTTSAGGANGFGTAFAFTVNTQNPLSVSENTLVSFNKATPSSTEGETPNGGLFSDANGNLFGTTSGGGANNDGTVFELPFANASYAATPTTLISFDGADGSSPQSTLIQDAAGDFFGTTFAGGTNGGGTVFEIPHTGGLLTLFSFANTLQPAATAGLIMDAAGDLFDTTYAGGSDSDGSVFEIAKTNTGYASAPTTLVSFNGTDGATPEAGLIMDAAGDLFGTTSGGGTFGEGTVFEIPFVNGSYASAPTILVSFNVENGDGAFPAATLTADAAGDLFGTTEQGGANGDGTVFELTGTGFQTPAPPTPTPPATTADLILRETTGASAGQLDVFDLGNNAILAGNVLGSIGLSWQIMGLGAFASNPNEADMLMRDTNNGSIEYFDIQHNQITGAGSMGGIGNEWQVLGVGDFSGNTNETDMLMRDTNNGSIEYFDIQHNQITGAGSMGGIGNEWQVLGVGDFSGNTNETDMLMRDTNNGSIEYFGIQHNQITGAGSMGGIGNEWQVLGVGDFSGNTNETDMLMRDTNNGSIEYFGIQHNQITGAGSMGGIGNEWQVLGVGDFSGNTNETDMLMRDTNNGSIEYFGIQHNQITGAGSMGGIGSEWQVLGVGNPLVLGNQLV